MSVLSLVFLQTADWSNSKKNDITDTYLANENDPLLRSQVQWGLRLRIISFIRSFRFL